MSGELRPLVTGAGALLGSELRVSASRGGGTLPLALIKPSASQPRHTIHAQPLEELAASIKAHGVIQAIVVRPLATSTAGGPRYEIVAGERRWQAAKLAGLTGIPCLVRELSDAQAVAMALIENIQREDLTAAEQARAFKRLAEEHALTHQQVADAVGRSRVAVTNLLRLLDLPETVVAMIDSKELSMGHARALLGLDHDVDRERIARVVIARGSSVRDTEHLVRKTVELQNRRVPVKRPELAVVSEVLRTATVQVQLHQRASGAGKLIVEFADAATRDALVAALEQALA